MEVIKPTAGFDFKRLSLANPEPLQSGSYFTKLSLENNKLLCIQMPKCTTKQGLIDIKGVKYCDLMYERSTHEELMNWLEQLEYACQDKLNEKKDLWFQTELSRDDIESMMSPIMRVYQSGKYILIRISLNAQKIGGLDKSIAYNEQEVNIDLDKLSATDSIIPLIVINGIKFSSRSFEIDIKLSQMMIFDKVTESQCLIKLANGVGANGVGANGVGANGVGANGVGANGVVQDKPLVMQDKPLVVQDKPLVVQDKHLVMQDKPLVVQDKPLVMQDKPLVVVDKPLVVQDKPLVLDKPLIVQDKPLVIQNNPNSNSLEEVSFNYDTISESINLKKPNEVYYAVYRVAREKAKQLRKVAMEAYLEAKEIKTKYMLDEFDDSEEDSDSDSEDT